MTAVADVAIVVVRVVCPHYVTSRFAHVVVAWSGAWPGCELSALSGVRPHYVTSRFAHVVVAWSGQGTSCIFQLRVWRTYTRQRRRTVCLSEERRGCCESARAAETAEEREVRLQLLRRHGKSRDCYIQATSISHLQQAGPGYNESAAETEGAR